MKPIFRISKEGKHVQKEMKELEKLMVAVGFPAGGPVDENGVSIAEYAAYNDLGTNRAPSRPFMRNSAEKHGDDYNKIAAQAIRDIMNGGTAQAALEKLGVFAKGIVQEEITDGVYEPNSEATIMAKGSDKPLIDTGTMRNSVNYEIRKR